MYGFKQNSFNTNQTNLNLYQQLKVSSVGMGTKFTGAKR
jgi:hypothetical protein